ncbi:MAG: hypothetical protein IPF99_41755 [Deltaproteobacteria bacterium]|nr:hypothetical protein [Deltaproteobacteria bacterium]
MPLVVCTYPGALGRASSGRLRAIIDRGNVTLVERPMHTRTLVSAMRAALNARGRQYELRDLIERQRGAPAEAPRPRAELKDEFLATVSHELRTPLTAMLGWAEMLRMGRLSELKQRQALATIERNARAQVQLVEDLLDVSRIVSVTAAGGGRGDASAVRRVGGGVGARGGRRQGGGPGARPRPDARPGARRRGEAAAGGLEPPHQRGEVHPSGRLGEGHLAPRGVAGGAALPRHGPRGLAGVPAVHVRSLPSGGRVEHPRSGRPRPRARHREAPRRAARRDHRGAQRGRRPRLGVHRPAPGARGRPPRGAAPSRGSFALVARLRLPAGGGRAAGAGRRGRARHPQPPGDAARALPRAGLQRRERRGGPRARRPRRARPDDLRHRDARRRRVRAHTGRALDAPRPRQPGARDRAHRLRPRRRPRSGPPRWLRRAPLQARRAARAGVGDCVARPLQRPAPLRPVAAGAGRAVASRAPWRCRSLFRG